MTLQTDVEYLETDRLILRRVRPADLGFFARIHADPEVARYISHGRPRTEDESHDWLDALLRTYDSLSLGQLAVERRSDGELLGRCGISDLSIEIGTPAPTRPLLFWSREQIPAGACVDLEQEFGYTFDRAHWGHGYAREAVRAVLDYSNRAAEPRSLVSIIHPENLRSVRLVTHFDARRDNEVESMGRTFDRYIWPRTA